LRSGFTTCFRITHELCLKDRNWFLHESCLDNWDDFLLIYRHLNVLLFVRSAHNWLADIHNFVDCFVDFALNWNNLRHIVRNILFTVDWHFDGNRNRYMNWDLNYLDNGDSFADLNIVWHCFVDGSWNILDKMLLGANLSDRRLILLKLETIIVNNPVALR